MDLGEKFNFGSQNCLKNSLKSFNEIISFYRGEIETQKEWRLTKGHNANSEQSWNYSFIQLFMEFTI